MTQSKKRGPYKKHPKTTIKEIKEEKIMAPTEEINPNILPPVEEAKIIPAEDFERLMADKDAALKNYETIVEGMRKENTGLIQQYNKDMTYMAEINSNIVKNFRAKEDAVLKIIEGTMALITLDRATIAPERKEN